MTAACAHETTPAQARRLVTLDWLVTPSWRVLHHAGLSDAAAVELVDGGMLDGWVRLDCGQTAAGLRIPGVLSRLGRRRCTGCCWVTGMPAGDGSPKNDAACRRLLGLDGGAS